MQKLNFYDFAGILAPGAVAVYGLTRIYPSLGILAPDDKVSFGEFGLLLVLAYVAGQLLQSLGNLIEWIWWALCGGRPTDWVRTGRHHILAGAQSKLIPQKIRELLQIECKHDLKSFSAAEWRSIRKQVYSKVRSAGRSQRTDIFNGIYGMFRGVAASLFVILIAALVEAEQPNWKLYGVLVILALLALLRMHRFGINYARELFVEFLNIRSDERDLPAKKDETE